MSRESGAIQSAALLHRMGEFCVLYHSQEWGNQGNNLTEETLADALRIFAAPFAARIKASWGLPMMLRKLIGAIFVLPSMQVCREQVLMRLAAAMNNGEPEAAIERLRRLAGIA